MRSSVSMVMRLPSRRRCTSLPSLTARRPNVVSAISAWRQNSEIRLRIWSFFIGPENLERGLGSTGGQRQMAGVSYHHLPNGYTPTKQIGTRHTCQYTSRQNDTSECECSNDIAPLPCCC